MMKFLFRTSWHHILRMPYASMAVVFVFTFLILSGFFGYSLYIFLIQEKVSIEKEFTYPLALNALYSLDSQRVKDFAESLALIDQMGPVTYIPRELSLDREILKNPGIMGILSGDNPLPDIILVPLAGVDIDIFWQRIQEFHDLFEGGIEKKNLRIRLNSYHQSLDEINSIVTSLVLVAGLVAVLIVILLITILRYQLRLFAPERIVGEIVGADPIFIWGPHVITGAVYLLISGFCGFGLFRLLQYFF